MNQSSHKPLLLVLLLFLCLENKGQAQEKSDSIVIHNIYHSMLTEGQGYDWLRILCLNIGHRISGSEQLARADTYMKSIMDSLHFDSVWLQPCKVPHWVRGKEEEGSVISSPFGSFPIDLLTLGNVNGTNGNFIKGQIIMVKSLEELKLMDDSRIKGKIVFINKPFEEAHLNTFQGYSNTVPIRSSGMGLAMQKGAIAILVRSVTTKSDNHPHAGGTRIEDNAYQIPAFAISLQSADKIAEALGKGPCVVKFKSNALYLGLTDGYNVIGEIKGDSLPEEIIVLGGHIDSWDVGQGAHDDGAGCVHSIEAVQVLRRIGYKPKRTLRVVLFVNEENGVAGAIQYMKYATQAPEKHIMAIESDAGGHTPTGFFIDARADKFPPFQSKVNSWNDLLSPYLLKFFPGHSGADIGFLKDMGTCLAGLAPDSQRYFDYHHSENDTFDKVNKRELHIGTAAIASFIYLTDKYGCE